MAGNQRFQDEKALGQGLGEIRNIISGLASGLPVGEPDENNDEQVNDLQRALPSEIARVSTKINKLEKELA